MTWKSTMLRLYKDERGISLEMKRRAALSSGGNENSGFAALSKEERTELARKAGSMPNPNRKLTPRQVRAIRASTQSLSVLAEKYNLSPSYISKIRQGTRYKDIK